MLPWQSDSSMATSFRNDGWVTPISIERNESSIRFAASFSRWRKTSHEVAGQLITSIRTTTLVGRSALPFVISTEAKRSGEISVWMLLPGSVLAKGNVMDLYYFLGSSG
jgi:hypothetical protein